MSWLEMTLTDCGVSMSGVPVLVADGIGIHDDGRAEGSILAAVRVFLRAERGGRQGKCAGSQ